MNELRFFLHSSGIHKLFPVYRLHLLYETFSQKPLGLSDPSRCVFICEMGIVKFSKGLVLPLIVIVILTEKNV